MESTVSGDGRVLIVGAGPAGLAAARELDRLGHHRWLILERNRHPGGLAASVVDPTGFTWDHGGHVVFSHFGEFDRLLTEVMGDDVYEHDRSSFVRFEDRWVPYPFQNNLHHLPPQAAFECLAGLVEAPGGDSQMDFAAWMEATFGLGITKHFMAPYNFKVWATPPEMMSSGWIAERVSVVDYRRALESMVYRRDDAGWGPNNTFVFPRRGGTGEIYRRAALPIADRIRYGAEVVEVERAARRVHCADGSEEAYDAIVSTMPLDLLVGAISDVPAHLRKAAKELTHNSVYMVGVGYEAPLSDDRSWMYFPDPDVPFYRATNFAKYSPANVPGGDTSRYCAYMTETAYSAHKAVPPVGLEERVEEGLRLAGVVSGELPVASLHTVDIPYAYPVPTSGRDRALRSIQPWLMEGAIYSRGRFGAWKYEIGNMDHAVKMGIDVARHIVAGEAEELWSL